MIRYIIVLILIFSFTGSFGQNGSSNSIGTRLGIVKSIYYDETLNYKIYHKTGVNPYHLRFRRIADKNSYIIDFCYIGATLGPMIRENRVLSDEITLRTGILDFACFRKLFDPAEKLDIKAGIHLKANGFNAERNFRKAYPAIGTTTQSTYEITFFSVNPCSEISYAIFGSTELNLIVSLPVLAVNSKNYNSRISPFNNVWLVSFGKYSGFSSDLSLLKRFNRFSFEIFQSVYFAKYKNPNNKKLMISTTGIGLYYEF